jgi:hypothetical protein
MFVYCEGQGWPRAIQIPAASTKHKGQSHPCGDFFICRAIKESKNSEADSIANNVQLNTEGFT